MTGIILTIIADPLFYALAIPAVIALGLSKGGFAGMGQMSTPMLAIIMPPLEAAAILLPIMLVQDANAVWVYRKDWNGRIVAIFVRLALQQRRRGYLVHLPRVWRLLEGQLSKPELAPVADWFARHLPPGTRADFVVPEPD